MKLAQFFREVAVPGFAFAGVIYLLYLAYGWSCGL